MPRPARIDRAAVLAASMAIADERGLAAVTMQAVAERLGVTAMALYRHVANKADLLDGLVEALLTEFSLPDAQLPFTERMSAIGQAVRATARRHPEVFGLLLQRSAATPAATRVRDEVYAALREAGVPEQQIPRTERLVSTMVLGFAASEAGGRFAAHSAAEIDGDFADLEDIIEQMLQSRVAVAAEHASA